MHHRHLQMFTWVYKLVLIFVTAQSVLTYLACSLLHGPLSNPMAPKSPLSKNSSSRSPNSSFFSSFFCIPQIYPYLTMGFLACLCLSPSPNWVFTVVGGCGGTNRNNFPLLSFTQEQTQHSSAGESAEVLWEVWSWQRRGGWGGCSGSWKGLCKEQSILLG